MNLTIEMSECLPTEEGIYYMMLKEGKRSRAMMVYVYQDSRGVMHVRPVVSSGITRTLDSRKGVNLFSVQPIQFNFVKRTEGGEEVLSRDCPV